MAPNAPNEPAPLSVGEVSLAAAWPVLETERLRLVADEVSLGPAVARFQRCNREHLLPWDPPTPEVFFTDEFQAQRVRAGVEAFRAGLAFRYWVQWREAPDAVIGTVHFSQVSRGAFHNALLGYALDAQCQGQGLMHEALQAGLVEMFSPRVNLHRIQAAWQPHNHRSGAVLRRLGFEDEGLARDYLFIHGAWRDHRIAALRNPGFRPPSGWGPPAGPATTPAGLTTASFRAAGAS